MFLTPIKAKDIAVAFIIGFLTFLAIKKPPTIFIASSAIAPNPVDPAIRAVNCSTNGSVTDAIPIPMTMFFMETPALPRLRLTRVLLLLRAIGLTLRVVRALVLDLLARLTVRLLDRLLNSPMPALLL